MSGINGLLKSCRERAGLTQQELSKKLHVDRSMIAKIETGVVVQPSYTLVKNWAQATDSMDMIGLEFFGHEGLKKYSHFENTLKTIKKVMEAVSFMKIKRLGRQKSGCL